jgi:FeS assembly SUF system protein
MNDAIVDFNREDEREPLTNAQLSASASVEEMIITALRSIYDPELPVNIYDLGLIYNIDIKERDVDVVMTLTSPNCPVAGSMPAQVECAIKSLDQIDNVCVELTWDPPWDSEKLSDEVKLTLGLL